MRPAHPNRRGHCVGRYDKKNGLSGEGEYTMVLLPGLMGTPERDFGFILPDLSREFNVEKVCFRGFGRKQNDPLTHLSVEDIVRDLVHFIDQKEIVKPYVFGYCFGGHVALRLALEYPNHARGVFCYGTKVFWNKEDAENSKRIYNLDRIKHQNPAWYYRLRKDHGVNLEQVSNLSKSLSEEIVGFFHEGRDKFMNTRMECIFIYGETDDLATADEAIILETLNKHFSCYVIPGVGHNMILTDPAPVMVILTTHVFGAF
jgi:pimeloyl-ACP methyl ester carboxylesterase